MFIAGFCILLGLIFTNVEYKVRQGVIGVNAIIVVFYFIGYLYWTGSINSKTTITARILWNKSVFNHELYRDVEIKKNEGLVRRIEIDIIITEGVIHCEKLKVRKD